jgi:putative transposase
VREWSRKRGRSSFFVDRPIAARYHPPISRGPRQAPGGFVYHVLNRGVARLPLFETPADYAAFLRVLAEALDECPMRILAFVLMPNHWHFVLWPGTF